MSAVGSIPNWPFSSLKKNSRLWALRHAIIIPPVGLLSKLFVDGFCRTKVVGVGRLRGAVERRLPGQGLLTVCNHHSCLDDPGLNGLLTWKQLLFSPSKIRWSPGGHNILFTNPLYNWYFASGKCVPIVRGHGVYQRAVNFLVERLSLGEWVHLFPEGQVNTCSHHVPSPHHHHQHQHDDTCYRRPLLPLRWGVGRLLLEPKITPILLPYYHVGMDRVLPNKEPPLPNAVRSSLSWWQQQRLRLREQCQFYWPRPRRRVTVVVGHPVSLTDIIGELRSGGASAQLARATITRHVQKALEELRVHALAAHAHRLRDDCT